MIFMSIYYCSILNFAALPSTSIVSCVLGICGLAPIEKEFKIPVLELPNVIPGLEEWDKNLHSILNISLYFNDSMVPITTLRAISEFSKSSVFVPFGFGHVHFGSLKKLRLYGWNFDSLGPESHAVTGTFFFISGKDFPTCFKFAHFRLRCTKTFNSQHFNLCRYS